MNGPETSRSTGSYEAQDQGLLTLFAELKDGLLKLLHQELSLAHVEIERRTKGVGQAIKGLSKGVTVTAISGIVTALAGANLIVQLFVAFNFPEWVGWAFLMTLGLLALFIGQSMCQSATLALREESSAEGPLIASLKEDKEWLENKLK